MLFGFKVKTESSIVTETVKIITTHNLFDFFQVFYIFARSTKRLQSIFTVHCGGKKTKKKSKHEYIHHNPGRKA